MRSIVIVIQAGMSTKLTLTTLFGDQKGISQQRYNRRSWQLQDEADSPEPPGEGVAGGT